MMKKQYLGLAVIASLFLNDHIHANAYCHVRGTPKALTDFDLIPKQQVAFGTGLGTISTPSFTQSSASQPVNTKPNYVLALEGGQGTIFKNDAEAKRICTELLGEEDWDGTYFNNNNYQDYASENKKRGVVVYNDKCWGGEGSECFCSNTKQLGICLRPVNGNKVVCNCNAPLTPEETKKFTENQMRKLDDTFRSLNKSTQDTMAPFYNKIKTGALNFWSPEISGILPNAYLPSDNACRGKYPEAPCICENSNARGICGINRSASGMKKYTLFCHCD